MCCPLRRIFLSCRRQSLAVGLVIFAAGCSDSSVSHITRPMSATKCQTALAGLPTSFPSSGARLNATVSAARECTWTVQSEGPWVQITPGSDQGEASVRVVVAENPAAIGRSTAILVNA
jgi:hypothetical protein